MRGLHHGLTLACCTLLGWAVFAGCASVDEPEAGQPIAGDIDAPGVLTSEEVNQLANNLADDDDFIEQVSEHIPAGEDGADGDVGLPGLHCWDLNANDTCDTAEDANSDGQCDARDCQGSPGSSGGDGVWYVNGSSAYYDDGNVGIGTSDPAESLSVNGTVESMTGGFKFPDGTIQETAAIGGSGDGDITAVLTPAGGGLTGGENAGVVTLSVDISGASTGDALTYDGTSVVWDSLGGGSPSGQAGGDLMGNYPDPDIASDAITSAHLADNSVTSSEIADAAVTLAKIDSSGASSGQAIMFDGGSVGWIAPGGGPPSGQAGGDLAGNYPNPDVAADAITSAHLANNSVTSSQITDGAVTNQKISSVSPGKITPQGAGSGLDADTVDGLHASELGGGGSSPWEESGNNIYYDAGNVGIGMSNPTNALGVSGQVDIWGPTNGPALRIKRQGGGNDQGFLRLRPDNALHIAGESWIYLDAGSGRQISCINPTTGVWHEIHASAFVQHSSRESKQNIRALDTTALAHSLEQILSLRPVTYSYKWEPQQSEGELGTHLGLIAEDVPPELLGESRKGVDLYALSTTLVAAVQQLNSQATTQIEALRQENNTLRDRVGALESIVKGKTPNAEGWVGEVAAQRRH